MTSATDDLSGTQYVVLTHLCVSSVTRSLTTFTRRVRGKAILEATTSTPRSNGSLEYVISVLVKVWDMNTSSSGS